MPHRRPASEQAIYVTWHAKTFLIIPFCSYLKIGIITLLDWKNIFYGFMCRLMGYQTIPVRKSSQATRQLMRFLKQGTNVALALDGPWGPAGKMKSGAFFLAQKTNSPIIPVRIETEKSWRMNWRWDRYEIPKPFSQIRVFISPAISAGENIEVARAKVLEWIGPA